MNERDSFLRAIGEAWDDPTPILVFADWAEEHGTDNPHLLRWFAWHVMPALAGVPRKCGRASNGDRDRAAKAVGRHPQKDVLFRCAAVAFCRRPAVWDGVENESVRVAVARCRLLALGLADAATRDREWRRAHAAANAMTTPITTAYAAEDFVLVGQLADRSRAFLLAAEVLAERPHLVRASVANRAIIPVPLDLHPDERAWQAAVYAALAAVPPMVADTQRDEVEVVREVTTKPLPPMKLPRGKFRRIVVRGRAYGWRACVDPEWWTGVGVYAILVRSADNTGQRLVVHPAPQLVLPGLVARVIGDALDGGWRPTENDLPNFMWDGTPYLAEPST